MLGERREHGFHARRHGTLAGAIQLGWLDGTGAAFGRQLLGNFFQGAPGENRTVVLVDVPRGVLFGVLVFDKQPFVALLAVPKFDENETPAKLLAVQVEFYLAALDLLTSVRVADDAERSPIPHHHRPRAVAALGNLALETGVVKRMIFNMNGEALIGRVERRSLGHRPGLQRAVYRQTEIVMQAPS